jgi:hypothetical protein
MSGLFLFVLISITVACVCGLIAWGFWLIFCLRAAEKHGLQLMAEAAPKIAVAYRNAALFSWVATVLTATASRLTKAARAALGDDERPPS